MAGVYVQLRPVRSSVARPTSRPLSNTRRFSPVTGTEVRVPLREGVASSVLAPAATIPCSGPLLSTTAVMAVRIVGGTVSRMMAQGADRGPAASRAEITRAVNVKVTRLEFGRVGVNVQLWPLTLATPSREAPL